MNAITMDNRTNRNISSRNKRKRIFQNVLMVFNILLLAAAVVIAAMVLTGCSKEPETYPEAEAMVAAELEALKSSVATAAVPEAISEGAEQFDSALLDAYVEKLKEFDYEIVGSTKAETGNKNDVSVIVRVTTYDFANEFLKAWNEYMTTEEQNRWQSQFYSHLLLRLASVSSKDYKADAQVICTEGDDGSWTTDLQGNEELMNAISGGMMNEIKNLMTDDVIMDETELND